jgi:hypothetical protein
MKPLNASDIANLHEYELERPAFRDAVIEKKKRRRISAVHYIRFPLGEEGRAALAAGREAALEVDHGGYRARQVLPKEPVGELIADLSEGVSGNL